jgi:hypothetical protein
MNKIQKLTSVSQFNLARRQETLHPLVTVLDQVKSQQIKQAGICRKSPCYLFKEF